MIKKTSYLKDLFKREGIIRVMGAHNGLGAKLIERNHFDAVWASGFEISASYGVPDANILTMTENLAAACSINQATSLPVICDCDTGYGNASNVKYMVKKYEAEGLAAVVIEDKVFPKVNSFIPGRQQLVSIQEFSDKIEAAKSTQKDPDFMVFARVEALIAGWGMDEALERAHAYVKAGADGIVIHSKKRTPEEILTFTKLWDPETPLVVIPTTYHEITAKELAHYKVKMVIYANHGLRSAFSAMNSTFEEIYKQERSTSVESKIASMKDVFELQGANDLKEDEKKYLKRENIQVIIPAAKDHRDHPEFKKVLGDRPLCMLNIAGQTLLSRQLTYFRAAGISDVCVVGGNQHDKIQGHDLEVLYNPYYASHHSLHSILFAKDYFKNKVMIIYSDIIFNKQILDHLLKSPAPITLVIDRAYQMLPARDKKLDLVITTKTRQDTGERDLFLNTYKPIQRIGKDIDKTTVTHEFIGMVYFQNEGIQQFLQACYDAEQTYKDRPFYEADNFSQAGLTDLIQYLIDQKVSVMGMEIEQGWSEIHSLEDYRRVNSYFEKK